MCEDREVVSRQVVSIARVFPEFDHGVDAAWKTTERVFHERPHRSVAQHLPVLLLEALANERRQIDSGLRAVRSWTTTTRTFRSFVRRSGRIPISCFA